MKTCNSNGFLEGVVGRWCDSTCSRAGSNPCTRGNRGWREQSVRGDSKISKRKEGRNEREIDTAEREELEEEEDVEVSGFHD